MRTITRAAGTVFAAAVLATGLASAAGAATVPGPSRVAAVDTVLVPDLNPQPLPPGIAAPQGRRCSSRCHGGA